jgi:hypothetical protein
MCSTSSRRGEFMWVQVGGPLHTETLSLYPVDGTATESR